MGTVFLLFSGTNDRAGYALARGVARCGGRLAVVAMTPRDKMLMGGYRRHVVSVRENANLSMSVLADHVARARRATGADRLTLLPISEYFNTFLFEHRATIESTLDCVVPLPPAEVYRQLTNKASAAAFFSANGVLVPSEIDQPGSADVPFVAKPANNISGGRSYYPVLVETEAELAELKRRPTLDGYFFQRFVRGRSYYLLAYVSRRGAVFASSQENLVQQPDGKSILLAIESDFHSTETARRAVQAIVGMGFHGFVMIEFIVNSQGAFFIELNPRPWGPLDLCLHNGSRIVEAFVGDWESDDPGRHAGGVYRHGRPARYLWTGGLVQSLRRRGRVDHRTLSAPLAAIEVLKSARDDVYLRKDSWRVFLREIFE